MSFIFVSMTVLLSSVQQRSPQMEEHHSHQATYELMVKDQISALETWSLCSG